MSHCTCHNLPLHKKMAWNTKGRQGQSCWRWNHELLTNYGPHQKWFFAFSSIHGHRLGFSWPLLATCLTLSNSYLASLWPSGNPLGINLGAWDGHASLAELRATFGSWTLYSICFPVSAPGRASTRKLSTAEHSDSLITLIVLKAHNLFTECFLSIRPVLHSSMC